MQKLNFDYDDSSNSYVAEYRGLTIRAEQDSDAENPFDAWEGEPPTVVYSGRSDWNDYSNGTVEEPLAAFTLGQISRHWRKLCAILEIDPAQHDADVKETRAGWSYGGAPDTAALRKEAFEEALSDAKQGNKSDYLETLAQLWSLAGVTAETWSSSGYSQGDYAHGLSVATPQWVKEVGAPKASHAAQCKAAGKLWGYWAWGDVFGYTVENEQGDTLDSCCGFYGDDFEQSGLAEQARDSADSHANERDAMQAPALAYQGGILDGIAAHG